MAIPDTPGLNNTIRTGLLFLIAASAAHYLAGGVSASWASLADGGIGVLYGVSIGCMVLGLKRSRERCGAN